MFWYLGDLYLFLLCLGVQLSYFVHQSFFNLESLNFVFMFKKGTRMKSYMHKYVFQWFGNCKCELYQFQHLVVNRCFNMYEHI